MDVDLAALAAFVTIASVISLSLWADVRHATERRERLDRARRHP